MKTNHLYINIELQPKTYKTHKLTFNITYSFLLDFDTSFPIYLQQRIMIQPKYAWLIIEAKKVRSKSQACSCPSYSPTANYFQKHHQRKENKLTILQQQNRILKKENQVMRQYFATMGRRNNEYAQNKKYEKHQVGNGDYQNNKRFSNSLFKDKDQARTMETDEKRKKKVLVYGLKNKAKF